MERPITRQELLELIEEAAQTGQTELDLRNKGIRELPAEIGKLTHLIKLDLGNYSNKRNKNQLTRLPDVIGQLSNLQSLYLSGNKLTQVPDVIGQFSNLQSLYLYNNKLTGLPDVIDQLSHLQILDLSGNKLTRLPDVVGQFSNLQLLYLRSNKLTELPDVIDQLANLQELDLSDNQLTELSDVIGQLSNLRSLDLSDNQLMRLSDGIGQLSNLKLLNLKSNKLTGLPDTIGHLSNLESLDLNQNQLIGLPNTIGQLSNLQWLDLRANQLKGQPDGIGQLSNLQSLFLSGSELTELSSVIEQLSNLYRFYLSENQSMELFDVIGKLSNLKELYLVNNRFTELPDTIGKLSNLRTLYLSGNQLTELPDVISQLSSLESLNLTGNKLTVLPDVIGKLSHLRSLDLRSNKLTALPDLISQLSHLQSLNLTGNKLTAWPDVIGQFSSLKSLHLSENQLAGLPSRIGQLSNLRKLDLDRNPLNPPLQSAYDAGFDSVMSYLRSLRDAEPLHEAKLVLVGEGNVGKTTLLKALMGKDTRSDEPTTHGVSIDIEALYLPHPKLNDTTIQFNAWDFGGQEVYRVTHQFFFSPRAVYLLLWEPRLGVQQCQVEDWLKLIRLRVGDKARVIIVSTHCRTGGRIARIDQPVLKRDFGEMIVGFHEVDSLVVDVQTGEMVGIVELKEKIADAAKSLPQMGMKFNLHWREARDELIALGEKRPLVTYREFSEICQANSLDTIATHTLAILMHDLGYIVYYGDDERLKEDVVLQPEWLTKAIGFVLEDRMTQEMAGILPDERLHEVWLDHSFEQEPRYGTHLYPFFLRLMEKYDVSYRLESGDASLVAQHVPQVRPSLPWLPDEAPEERLRRLTMICEMEESPPGLVPWMIVRTHDYSYEWHANAEDVVTRLHWQKGMFLRNITHGTALLELRERNFFIHVEAVWPQYFMKVLETTLNQLIIENWPGLKDRYTFRVPCRGQYRGLPCTGSFSIDALRDYLDEGDSTIRCERCRSRQAIVSLLYGWEDQNEREQLKRIESKLDQVGARMQQNLSQITTHLTELESRVANTFWSLMHAIASEAKHGPRLYTIRAVDNALWRTGFKRRCELHLWCEAEGCQHPVFERGKGVYPIEMNREWLDNVAPYLNFAYRVLKPAAFLATPALNSVFGEEFIENQGIGEQLELADRTLQTLPVGTAQLDSPTSGSNAISYIERTGLLTLHHFLKEQDPTHAHLGLHRMPTYTGDYRWLCRHHYEAAQSKIPDRIG